MKRTGIVLAIALLGAGLAWGQYGYQYMSGGYWFGAQFIGQEGWMVGAKGAIMHTTDGGRNWVSQSNIERKLGYEPPNLSFSDVFFVNPQEGWACIDNLTQFVWHTTDGGRFWKAESMSLGTRYGYALTSKVFFVTPLVGWIAGGNPNSFYDYGDILATTNGGRTWAYQDSSHGWYGIWATDANHCWAVGNYGWTARTTDGGSIWFSQQVGPFITYYDVFFTDTLFGWACGHPGVVVHTTDGGQSWSQQPIGTTTEFSTLLFLDRRKGFVVGDSGVILKTTDGGTHWAQVPTGVTAYLSTISFGDSLHGLAMGEGGTTVETSDGGQTWLISREGTTDRLQSVVFVGDSTGWTVSSEGKLFSTSNEGKNWRKRWFGPTYDAIEMVNPSTGWLVGENGRVIGTNDGWNTSYDPVDVTQENLKDVFAGDALHAWACGTKMEVIGTSNGGQTWQEQFTRPDTTLYDITFCDSVYGWALFKDGHVLRTRNGGQSWGMVGSTGKGNWYHGDYVDSLWGWAAGDSGISRSTDGGRSWIRQNTGITERLWDVSGVSRLRAWAVGENGRIVATTDGGTSWTIQTSPVSTVLRSVDFVDSLHGVACGYGYILETRNGGNTWNLHAVGDNNAITLVDSLEGWAVGNRIYHTTDGGTTWQEVHANPTPLQAVCFINRDEGWAGGNQSQYEGYITHTTDRGITWTDSHYWFKLINSLHYADRLRGWIGTGGYLPGQMWATTDGGIGWNPLLYPKTFNTKGHAFSSRTGVVCGSLGNLFRTTDGTIWERVMPPTSTNFWDVTLGDEQTAWTVGQRGTIVASTDQGLSWRVQRAGTYPDSLLMSVQAFDGLTARATGYLGRSVLTTDGGTTWVGEETGTKEWLLASSFLTPTLGWVAGENGMVLKYGRLPYGVEEGEKTAGVPRVTWLGPNHPNPFTGGTEIKYQLASRGRVKLGVYNVLGQAVRELASGEQEAGTYVIRWNGKDGMGKTTSSGVYFYRLEAFGQSQTRKMVKIR
jgi:photosystem II stability/assembly factor-like uncharacterized protein